MFDQSNMDCSDIKNKLQPFLEDLLAEEEYRAFCGHLDTCGKCKGYVRSIGSFSNQLWKLGQIEVPEDLASTIRYKIMHPEENQPPAKVKKTGKRLAVGTVLILLAVVLLGGVAYFIKRGHSSGKTDTPTVKTEVFRTMEPLPDDEAEVLFRQLETMATRLGVSEKGNVIEGEGEKENPGD